MLSFDIRSLESHAAVVDEELPSDDPVWEEDDPKPAGVVRVSGRLSAAGPGRFYWHGKIDGDISLECSRCLTATERHVSDETHIIFADADDEVTVDLVVYRIDSAAVELDLRPAIREQWILAAPTYALCRDDCKGLCTWCGAYLSDGPGDCSQDEMDPRWEA